MTRSAKRIPKVVIALVLLVAMMPLGAAQQDNTTTGDGEGAGDDTDITIGTEGNFIGSTLMWVLLVFVIVLLVIVAIVAMSKAGSREHHD